MNGFELVQVVTLMVGAVMLPVIFGFQRVALYVERRHAEQRRQFRRDFYRD